jgi:hypothetical protein
VAELSEAAWKEASQHGLRGSSIDQELKLWKAVEQVVELHVERPTSRGQGRCEEFLAELTAAAYEVALAHGFRDSFIDVQLGLWNALRHAAKRPPAFRQKESEPCFGSHNS